MARHERRAQLPPGPPLGAAVTLLAAWTRPAAAMERLRRYGPRVTVALPFQPPTVVLSDPDDIRELFTAPDDVVHPGEGAAILKPIIGRHSVILLDERAHLAQRRLLLPAFHGERMLRLTDAMTALTRREVAAWPCDEPVALHPRLQGLTLDIILRSVFGLVGGAELEHLRGLLSDVLAYTESPLSVLPALQRWLAWTPVQRRFNRLMRETDELIFTLIAQRRASGEHGDGDDVLAMLLGARHEDGSPMSNEEMRDELMTALVAGHETTASQLAWTFERLAREPTVAARLTAEIDAGVEEGYLGAAINEILRLRPVLPHAEPRLVKREIEIGGVRYPPGVVLLASAQLVHHDPAIYEDPWAFRPERFLGVTPGTYTWIPFGGGRRRCLGASFAVQEMKIVLREVLSRYALEPGGGPPETTRRRSITFSPARGATVVLRARGVRAPRVAEAVAVGA